MTYPIQPPTNLSLVQRVLPDFELQRICLTSNGYDYPEYMRLIRKAFSFYCQVNLGPMRPATRTHLEEFLKVFLDTFVSPRFHVQKPDQLYFVSLNPIIANLLALSSFNTADVWLDRLFSTNQQLSKILTLMSPRTYRQMRPSDFCKYTDSCDQLQAAWWTTYPLAANCITSEHVQRRLREHFRSGPPPGFPHSTKFTDAHFIPTYADEDGAPSLKRQLNECIKAKWPQVPVNNTPDDTRIAIISDRWAPNTVVHKSVAPLVAALRSRFKLDLFHLGKDAGDLAVDTVGFDNVHFVHIDEDDQIQGLEPLQCNSYAAILYPDVGMNALSLILANQRFAPIQVSTTGHPVSTAGSEIDYFISGAEVEAPGAQRHYSERLVLLPGMGNQSVKPSYVPRKPKRTSTDVIINACWGPTKYNIPMLYAVRDAMRAAKAPCRVQFFPSNGVCRYQGLNPFLADIKEIFGNTAIAMPDRGGYDGYMQRLEFGDFGIDSFPFGGYNTIIDNWHLRKPMVTFRGDHWYSRVASAANDRLGMSELVATSYRSYQNLITRMIDDVVFRTRMSDQITDCALCREIYNNTEEPLAFCEAFEYLINQYPVPHPSLPINIGTGAQL